MFSKPLFPAREEKPASYPITSRQTPDYSETKDFERVIFYLHMNKILSIILLIM